MAFTEPDPDLEHVDLAEIKQLIPHRYPFLFIDKVINYRQHKGGVGIKGVTVNEEFFQGHFPTKPVMPGVLIIEAMAQTASVVVSKSLDFAGKNMLVFFMGLEKTRFRRMVVPGDQLELHVEVLRGGGKVYKFRGEARVDGDLAAESEFMAMIRPPEEGEH